MLQQIQVTHAEAETIGEWYRAVAADTAHMLSEIPSYTEGFDKPTYTDETLQNDNFMIYRRADETIIYELKKAGTEIDVFTKERTYILAKNSGDEDFQKVIKITRLHHKGDTLTNPQIVGVRPYSLRLNYSGTWLPEWGFAAAQLVNRAGEQAWVELAAPIAIAENIGKLTMPFGPHLSSATVDILFNEGNGRDEGRRVHIGQAISHRLKIVRMMAEQPSLDLLSAALRASAESDEGTC